jgi:hypothetical protein
MFENWKRKRLEKTPEYRSVAQQLESTTLDVMMNLIAIYLYPTSPDVETWTQNLYDSFSRVPRFANTQELPSAEFILRNTLEVNRSMIGRWTKKIASYSDDAETVEMIANYVVQDCEGFIAAYYEWLAIELSINQFVTADQIQDVISGLVEGRLVIESAAEASR